MSFSCFESFALDATRAKSILSAWPIPIAADIDGCINVITLS
jgi:hypothetical protein